MNNFTNSIAKLFICKLVIVQDRNEVKEREQLVLMGTAWLIDHQYAITAAHCIDDGIENVTLSFPTVQSIPAKLLEKDEHLDVALLKLEQPQSELNPLAICKRSDLDMKAQANWLAHGYPGVVSDRFDAGMTIGGKVRNFYLQFDGAPIIQLFCEDGVNEIDFKDANLGGMSGAPVIIQEQNNRVVGIIRYAPPKFAEKSLVATPVDVIVNRLKVVSVTQPQMSNQNQIQTPTPNDQETSFVVSGKIKNEPPNYIRRLLQYYLSAQEIQQPKTVLSFLPLLVGRWEQEDRVLQAVREHRSQENKQRDQPLLYVVHGSQLCDDLETTKVFLLEKRLLKKLEYCLENGILIDIDYLKKTGLEKFSLNFRGIPENQDELHRKMLIGLTERTPFGEPFASKDKIAEKIAVHKNPMIFFYPLFTESLPYGNEIEIIEGFISFWTNWPSQKQLLLIFLIVLYNDEGSQEKSTLFKYFGQIFRKKSSVTIRNQLNTLRDSKSKSTFNEHFSEFNVSGEVLQELKVLKRELDLWLYELDLWSNEYNNYIRNFFSSEMLSDEFQTLVKNYDNEFMTYPCGIPMNQLIKELRRIINQFTSNRYKT